jgi:hypothetical protein
MPAFSMRTSVMPEVPCDLEQHAAPAVDRSLGIVDRIAGKPWNEHERRQPSRALGEVTITLTSKPAAVRTDS